MSDTDRKSAGIGKGTPGPGRRKGVPNKATQEFRDTVRFVLESNRENVPYWLTLVAEGMPDHGIRPDPAKALDLLARLAEYAAPKLSRTEVAGDQANPVQHAVKVTFG